MISIIGDDRFISTLPVIRQPARHTMTLDQLATRLCNEAGDTNVEMIRSSSRARHLTPIRVALIQQATQLRVATLTEVANFLHDPSALSKLINSQSLPKRHKSSPVPMTCGAD